MIRPMYNSYSVTSSYLPDGYVPIDISKKPNDEIKADVSKFFSQNTGEKWHAPTFPNNYDDASKKWFSTKGNSQIKDENKAAQIVKSSGGRNQPVTKATLHEVDTGDFDIQKYLPVLLLGGGAVVMMMFMMM
jgi:hypothetical protein